MQFDIIIVGGGIAGATLAKVLAERGIRTLVIERETAFRDRVRGEAMHPWGVTEAKTLGVYDLMLGSCGQEVMLWTNYDTGRDVVRVRVLPETSRHRAGSLNFFHPEMQEVLLHAASMAGATVVRGATVTQVNGGSNPSIRYVDADQHEHVAAARLVVAADGRNSQARLQAGFTVKRDPPRLVMAGHLMRGLNANRDSVHWFYSAGKPGQAAIFFPLPEDRFRIYYVYHGHAGTRPLSGDANGQHFRAACTGAGAPATWFAGAESAGPLAMYQGADRSVDFPYREGVALIGDAAAASDPAWGSGLALTLRDIRELRDALLASPDDWHGACMAYATAHARYYHTLHTMEDWLTELLYAPGELAAARRKRALELFEREPDRAVDVVGVGLDTDVSETARQRFWGEDLSA